MRGDPAAAAAAVTLSAVSRRLSSFVIVRRARTRSACLPAAGDADVIGSITRNTLVYNAMLSQKQQNAAVDLRIRVLVNVLMVSDCWGRDRQNVTI